MGEEREETNIFLLHTHLQGVERFANYSGFGCTLKFDGDYVDEAHVCEELTHYYVCLLACVCS